jgi:cytochrome c peroxidase
MKKISVLLLFFCIIGFIFISFKNTNTETPYVLHYQQKLLVFQDEQQKLIEFIKTSELSSAKDREQIVQKINKVRRRLKPLDIWIRYLEPIAYKKINGPLPVEWETEVFEKFEKPYKREGAGLTLAAVYLGEEKSEKEKLLELINSSIEASKVYQTDSILRELETPNHFFLCNRLFLLNLAAIYTTGFECPDTSAIIPELRSMLGEVLPIYLSFNATFPATPYNENYLTLFKSALQFVNEQSANYSQFDHFAFIKHYVNPLFTRNQELIRCYQVSTKSYVDYSLTKTSTSIFSKALYNGQNSKGIFLRLKDETALAELDRVGKLLFYDPILSGNNKRSCVSCHQSNSFFTDTTCVTAMQYNQKDKLKRNSPSLIGAPYNHLLMLDGKHISMKDQAVSVITNPDEMCADEKEVLKKVLSCKDYKRAFKQLLKYTPQEKEITMEHITSALTFYYSKFSKYDAPFDEAMNADKPITSQAIRGFNLFMSKAQCATCHFVPQFNGVKPPYVGSEFEVLGVPEDTTFKKLSTDKGRYAINEAEETIHAFRTGTVRNAEKTKPYMHNGVFTDLNQVIDFYDAGGGKGRGLNVENQTLSADSLHLTQREKSELILFIRSLTENIQFELPPDHLPTSSISSLNERKVGGNY